MPLFSFANSVLGTLASDDLWYTNMTFQDHGGIENGAIS